MRWTATEWHDGMLTVHPESDLKPHDVQSEACWCRPFWEDTVLVHNSMDGREAFERGERKPS